MRTPLLLATVLLSGLMGCGSNKKPENEAEARDESHLKLIVTGYHIFIDNELKPPSNKEDLLTRIFSDKPIEFDRYVIIWGVDPRDIANPGSTVLAYVADVPEKGGMVAFVDGSVRKVGADEFRQHAKASPSKKLADKTADFSLSAADFAAGYKNRKYQRKTVEIKGTVTSFRSGHTSKEVVVEISGEVHCEMATPQPWAKLALNQQVTIKGTAPDTVSGPYMLVNCMIVATGENTGFSTSAADLIKEYEANPDATTTKYKDKSLVVTGEVLGPVKKDGGFLVTASLKGSANNVVVCKFDAPSHERAARLSAGDKIKFYGEFNAFIPNKKVTLEKCQLITD